MLQGENGESCKVCEKEKNAGIADKVENKNEIGREAKSFFRTKANRKLLHQKVSVIIAKN